MTFMISVLKDKKGDNFSNKVLKALENIDDDCDEQGIIFVKVNLYNFIILITKA